jgi:hypothetical protein
MKKIFLYHLWKSLVVLGGLFFVINIFRYINNPTIETLIGMGGFLLIFISLRKLTKQNLTK